MKLYRYIVKGIATDVGILIYLEEIFDRNNDKELDEMFDLIWPFEDQLKNPNILGWPGSRFWFTEKGNRHFNKAIRKIKKAYQSRNYEVERLEMDIEDDSPEIVYRDEYQVAIRRYKRKYFID